MGYWITPYIENERFYSKEEIEYELADCLYDYAIDTFDYWTEEHISSTEMLYRCMRYGPETVIDDIRDEIVKWLIDAADITPGRDVYVDGIRFRWVDDDNHSYNRKPKTARK